VKLEEGIAALGVELPAGAGEKLEMWLDLVEKWNRVYNLTSVRRREEMLTRHLLDCLAVLPHLDAAAARAEGPWCLLDVGSGAGLPGMVLAVARPQWSIDSVEAVDKKATFQRQAKIQLQLDNLNVHGQRVESLHKRVDAVISRAFSDAAQFIARAGHLADVLWAMKGVFPQAEIAMLPATWRLQALHEINVPGLDAERCLLQLEKIDTCTSSP